MAPEVGLEPTTTRLTVACSTIELLRNRRLRDAETTGRGFYGKLFLQRTEVPQTPVTQPGRHRRRRASLESPENPSPGDEHGGHNEGIYLLAAKRWQALMPA